MYVTASEAVGDTGEFGPRSYDAAGKERWRHPLGPFNLPNGAGAARVLHGKTVLLQMDQDTDSYLLAVDKDTGKQTWKTDGPHAPHGFSTASKRRKP